jgi:hypothetical protein
VDMVGRVNSGKQCRGGHVDSNRLLLFEASDGYIKSFGIGKGNSSQE